MKKSKQISMGYFQNLAVFAIITLNLGLGVSYMISWFIAGSQDLFWRADFTAFYTAGKMVQDGKWRDLYDIDAQKECQKNILGSRNFQGDVLPFINPPFTVFLFTPLARLPLNIAYLVWTILQLVLLSCLLCLLKQITSAWRPVERWLAFSAILAFPAILFTFLLGALSLITLIFLTLTYWALKKGRDSESGIWVVLASIKPQNIALMGISLLSAKRWKAILSSSIALMILTILPIFFFSGRIWLDYLNLLKFVGSLHNQYGIYPTGMYNFKGLLSFILGIENGALINGITWGAFVISGAIIFFVWKAPWNNIDASFELRMAFTILLGLLFSPHFNPQDSILLVLPAVLYYEYLRNRSLPSRNYAIFVLSTPLIFLLTHCIFTGFLRTSIPILIMTTIGIVMANALINERNGQNTPKEMTPAEL